MPDLEDRPIKVMLLGPSLDAVSGVSTHLNQLRLSSLASEFTLLHFQIGSEGRQESPLKKMGRYVFSPFQFFIRLLKHRPHIVHLNTSMGLKSFWRDLVYFFIAHAMGKKIVYQVHGGDLPADFFIRSGALTSLLKQALRRADTVILLTQEELRAYKKFAPGARLELIANAVDPGMDPAWKKTPPAQSRPLRLIYLGRLAESKGIFELVDALAMTHRQGMNIELAIAGSGPDEPRLRALVDKLDLTACVNFAGVVTGDEKKRIWEWADLFVFPTYYEGLPYALLEGMAARTPPLVCAVGGIPDLIDDGVHGLLIDVKDPAALASAIGRLNNDRQLICSMGEACRQRVASGYSIDRLAQDIGRTYRNVLTAP
jgi:glycosyltransferase involved in cell wall biosynthesis